MKRAALVLLLSLFAIATYAQQIPSFGTVAIPVTANQNAFTVLLTQNVTSFSFTGSLQTAPLVSVTFKQDATGGRTVTGFASNITNTCSVSGTAGASTVCLYQYDPSANSWSSAGSGSGGESGTVNAGALGQRTQYVGTTTIGTAGSNYFFADQYAGSDASVKINACITAVIALGGGTCDASNLGGVQTMSAQINVGGGSGNLVTANGNLVLILPQQAVWNWTITNGTSCGIMQYTNTVIKADHPGGDYAGTQLGAFSASTNMDSLYCTQPSPTQLGNNLSNVKAIGFLAANYNAGTFANGVIHIQSVSDQSYFSIGGLNYSGDAWHVQNVCCATNIDHSFGDSGQPGTTQAGGTTLTITGGGNGGDDLIVSNSTFNGPGVGDYNVFINPSVNTFSTSFTNDYFEKYGSDASTAMIYVGANAVNTQFYGGQLINNCASTCTQYAFENHSTNGLIIKGVGYGFFSTTGVNDIANSSTLASDGFTINDYEVGNSSARIVLPTFALGSSSVPSVKIGAPTFGIYNAGTNIGISTGGIAGFFDNAQRFNESLINISSVGYGTNNDTGLSRGGAGIVDVGTGAAASVAGQVNAAVFNPTPSTVSGLGAAAAGNKGFVRVVSDSTAVSAEGQTCVGSSTNTAMAFSNGTVWKCF